jgi:hypothetical protein
LSASRRPSTGSILIADAAGGVDDRCVVRSGSRLVVGAGRVALAYLGFGGGPSPSSAGEVLRAAVALSSGARSGSVICSMWTVTPKWQQGPVTKMAVAGAADFDAIAVP